MAKKDNKINIIFKTRNAALEEKEDNWTLILNAYRGGVDFLNGNYLIRYPKESQRSFEIRKTRAVYFNQLSPIVDMMSGMLFNSTPIRTIPKEMNYLIDSVSGDKKLDEFMRLVAAYSFMFTVAVLVDAPDFDPEQIKTQKDRRDNEINPYAVLYLPQRIRDFSISPDDGMLEWVILDDSYDKHSDPFVPNKKMIKYTLWTRTYYQTFEKEEMSTAEPVMSEQIPHPIGSVPVRFISWRDDNSDFIAESVCEDIAMISKLIYNNMSYMDEMLASGTFKMLAYPSKDGKVPEALVQGGVGPLGVLPYDIASSTMPSFIGAALGEIEPFIKALEFYMSEILKKVGLSTDETKKFVKSGMAKKIDMQKMRALLISGALMMGKTEEWIFETAGKWERKYDLEAKSEYGAQFSDEDLETEITMLTELLVYPVKNLQKNVLNLMVKKTLAKDLKPDILEEIYKDIEKSSLNLQQTMGGTFDTKKAAQEIKDKENNSNEK